MNSSPYFYLYKPKGKAIRSCALKTKAICYVAVNAKGYEQIAI